MARQYTETFGHIRTAYGKTFFRRVHSGKKRVPLVCLHGGPGSTHWSILNMIDFVQDRDVIFYDQIGCGLSDRLPKAKMKTPTFVSELESLRKSLGIKKFHLIGHSWGTMLAMDYYLKHSNTVKSIVFSSPCLSASAWQNDANNLIQKLPAKVIQTIQRHEGRGTTDSPDYHKAMDVYYRRFVFGKNLKPTVERAISRASRSAEVYETMWGPSEFCATGNLRSYERLDDLRKIRIPTLYTCGAEDEATPSTTKIYCEHTPGAKLHVFKKSAHVPQNTERSSYIRVIGRFFRAAD